MMDIPDEAWAAIHNGSYCSEAGAVELAAPHIARSAQVAVLREFEAKWGAIPLCCEWGGREYHDVKARLAELEAGAGQTGRDGP